MIGLDDAKIYWHKDLQDQYRVSAIMAPAIALSATRFALASLAFAIDGELLGESRGPLLRRRHPLRPQQELYDFLVTRLAGRARHFDQFVDQAGELLARNIVVGPAEIAVAMQDLRNRLLQRLAPVSFA